MQNKKNKQFSCSVHFASPSAGRDYRNKTTNPGIRFLLVFNTDHMVYNYMDIFDTATYICVYV